MADEFSIIRDYFKHLSANSVQVVKGPGDDCAVLQVAPEHELCVSTDTLIAGVHFPEDASAEIAATRTMMANLSDLAAMGATPHSFVLALTLPQADEAWLAEFAGSLKRLTETHHIPLVGGNLAKGRLSMTMTVMGQVPDGQSICRDTAMPGDLVYVSGSLGDAGHGLSLVLDKAEASYLTRRYTHPTARLALGQALRGIATSMIDVSDGLYADASHLAAESSVTLTLHQEKLPISDELGAAVGREAALKLALTAGDDYELCFTASPDSQQRIDEIAKALNLALTVVGEVTVGDAEAVVLDRNGEALVASGYTHF